jgi:hypothetical protein
VKCLIDPPRLFMVIVAGLSLCGCQRDFGRTALPFTQQWHLNRACAAAGREFLDDEHLGFNDRPSSIEAFYSAKINTCVQIEISNWPWSQQWRYTIRDVTNGLFSPVDRQQKAGDVVVRFDNVYEIFDCSWAGANSAIISKVQAFHGDVEDKAYSLWLDNGDGGPPATLKTPDHRYSQHECKRLLEKKLAEL